MNKILVFGGTFNPVTNAHIAIAYQAMAFVQANHLIFVPTDLNFLNTWKGMNSSQCLDNQLRIKLLNKVIANEPRFSVSCLEVDKVTSKTFDTLNILKSQYPDSELIFMCGDEKYLEFVHWYKWEELILNYHFLIVQRNYQNTYELMKESGLYSNVLNHFTFMQSDPTYHFISSTKLRNAILKGDKTMVQKISPEVIHDDLMQLIPTNYQTIKIANAIIEVKNGDVQWNTSQILKNIEKAKNNDCGLICFSELCLTGASLKDAYLRPYLYSAIENSIQQIIDKMPDNIIALIGSSFKVNHAIYNCVFVLKQKTILGIIPKSTINKYQQAYFKKAPICNSMIDFHGQKVCFGLHQLFNLDGMEFIVEIGDDAINPIKANNAYYRAQCIFNLSCMPHIYGMNKHMQLTYQVSAKNNCSIVVGCNGGLNESSSDYNYLPFVSIYDNDGCVIKCEDNYIETVIDYGKILFNKQSSNMEYSCDFALTECNVILNHSYLPKYIQQCCFVDDDFNDDDALQIIHMQANALKNRLNAIKCKDVVIGISGGLDSTLALIACYETMKMMHLSMDHIHAISMPGFGTSQQTRKNGTTLMDLVGCKYEVIDITDACRQHFKDIGQDETTFDITFENTQARERTQILFDNANQLNAIVVGTGDLSEIALGWCTYNGDHMSNYGLNAGIPKTVMKKILQGYANCYPQFNEVLKDILNTPISPELLPSKEGEFAQKTEASVGKYEINDFFIYHFIKNGFNKEKLLAYAIKAFKDIDPNELKEALNRFYYRFYTQQFKRNCAPECIDIFDISLNSVRGYTMVSDISSAIEHQD